MELQKESKFFEETPSNHASSDVILNPCNLGSEFDFR